MRKYYREEGAVEVKDLSDKEYVEFIESMPCNKSVEEQLEYVFSYVAFDEEGYRSEHHGGDGYYFVPDIDVYRFIEKKKCEEVLYWRLRVIKYQMEQLTSIKDKKYYLQAYLDSLMREVNGNPYILDGFNCTELKRQIDYLLPDWPTILKDGIPPFRGAILKGQGAAISKLKRHISELLEEIASDGIANEQKSARVTLEDFLSEQAVQLVPFLVEHYSNEKPRRIAYMLFALIQLGFMDDSVLHEHQTELVSAIKRTFKRELNRESIVYNIRTYEKTNDNNIRRKIDSIVKQLNEVILKP